jgi:hypothetical protein
VTASFYLRRHIGQRAWRIFHYVTFLAFAGTTIHGIASGSDSNAPWAEAIYLVSAATVLFLLTYRIGVSMTARADARAAAEAPRPASVPRRGPVGGRLTSGWLPAREGAPARRPMPILPVPSRPLPSSPTPSRPTSIRDGGSLRRDSVA